MKPEGDKCRSRHDESHRVGVIQMAEISQPPLPDGSQQQAATHEHRQRRNDQPFFQVHHFEKPFQLPVWRKKPSVMANVWAKMAKRIHWYPHKMARLANNRV